MKKFNKNSYKLAVFLSVYYIGVLIFLIISRNELDFTDLEKIWESFLTVVIGSIGLPIIGGLLMLYGAHLGERGGFEGLIPAELLGVIMLFGGPALAFAYPINILVTESLSIGTILSCALLLTLVLPVTLLTILIHGGTDLVQKGDFGPWIKSWREKLYGRIFEAD